MQTRVPVSTLQQLSELDDPEILEGYHDGLQNELTPGGNRSESYYHGWRNGRVDAGHIQPDEAQMKLAKAYIERGRL